MATVKRTLLLQCMEILGQWPNPAASLDPSYHRSLYNLAQSLCKKNVPTESWADEILVKAVLLLVDFPHPEADLMCAVERGHENVARALYNEWVARTYERLFEEPL